MFREVFRPLLLISVLLWSTVGVVRGELFYIGTSLIPGAVPRLNVKTIVLLQGQSSGSGLLAGFAAYYYTANVSVEFQIWRPISTTDTENFQLIGSYSYVLPSSAKVPDFQNIYLKDLNQQCIRIAVGDRVGINFKGDSWPVGYKYVGDSNRNATKTALIPDVVDFSNITLGSIVKANELVFPYQFQVVAWVVSGPGPSQGINQAEDCPSNATFSSWGATTTLPISTLRPTPPPGDTGSTGRMGPPGATGVNGTTGVIGDTGAIGPTGSTGSTGARGDPGAFGAVGSTGNTGLFGATGVLGFTGAIGVTGLPGFLGLPGKPGKNATYEERGTSTTSQPSDITYGSSWWTKKSFVLGMYVWMAILSALVLMLFIWAAVFLDNVNKKKSA